MSCIDCSSGGDQEGRCGARLEKVPRELEDFTSNDLSSSEITTTFRAAHTRAAR